MVPLYGFGAQIESSHFQNYTSHCFAMNGNFFRPEAHDLMGIDMVYKTAIARVPLSGPTFFAPIINQFNKMVQYYVNNTIRKYFTLLILTDGEIHDMDKTIDEIVISSSLPVSIIIVGIGGANFRSMEELDADEGRLWSTTYQKFQERDNVQFVEFRKFQGNGELLA